jgi:autotransporter-associated beta strand protein
MALGSPVLQAAPINAAADYTPTVSGTWETGSNWTTNPDYPSGDAAAVTFANGATATRTITINTAVTVPSITFNNGASNSTNTLPAGTGSITFDVPGTGTASLTANGTGTANNTFNVAIVLNDDLVVSSNQTGAASAGISLTGNVSGTGGITKNGPNMLTLNGTQKTYTGATTFNAGRIRLSTTANTIENSSSVRVNSGAQIEPINATTPIKTGAGSLFLNGTGLGPGSLPGDFPGAIRPSTGLQVSFTSPTVLESDTLIHSQALAADGVGASITFTNVVSGPGRLSLSAENSNLNLGSYILTNANTYSGGTVVNGGTLRASGAAATFGTGDVRVRNFLNARAAIDAGVANAIADSATLFLEGGGAAGTADIGFMSLGAGIDEIVGSLVLGGVTQTQIGTYGSTASAATFQSDEFFSGTGVVSLVPEPTSLALVGIGALGLLARRRRGVTR